jgi:hypothetical protein
VLLRVVPHERAERSELIAAVGDDLATADRIDPTASDAAVSPLLTR